MSAVAVAIQPPAPSTPTTVVAVAVTVVAWASAFPAIRAGLAAFGPRRARRHPLRHRRGSRGDLPGADAARPCRHGSQAWRFAFGGVVFVALYTDLLNFGELTVSAGAASFIINVNPIFTAVLAMLFLGERFQGWHGSAPSSRSPEWG